MWLRCWKISGLASLGILAWASGGAAETILVGVDKLAFTPAQVSARVGDTIEWTNADFVAHTATGRKKEWDVTIPAKGIGRVTLELWPKLGDGVLNKAAYRSGWKPA
jgi:plastocyanin